MKNFEKFAHDWQARLAEQQARMNAVVPSTRDEVTAQAVASIKALQQQAHDLAYSVRAATRKDPTQDLLNELEGSGGIPTRERSIGLPVLNKQALLGALTNPLKNGFQDAKVETARLLDQEATDRLKTTKSMSSLPWYMPAATLGSVSSFRQGYRKADSDATDSMHLNLDAKIETARSEFERALADEYKGRNSKYASAGELIDGLAEKHASGELNVAMGGYGSLAALLGAASYQQAKQETEDHDPRVMKMKAVRDLIRARMRSQPLMLRAEEQQPALATK